MKVFVGHDDREDIAYKVCEYSIKSKNNKLLVIPLKQQNLIQSGLYWREKDPLSSTTFTFTRFLVPVLMDYKGWALFCDCDFMWMIDPAEIMQYADKKYAVMVVKHDYNPPEGEKMDGQRQLPYPRKNWSSMILWNCEHPSNKQVTTELVNTESGQYLHRFDWLIDDEIGEIPHQWNWLVNHYHEPEDGVPLAIHYTEGGPWFDNYKHCEYGYHWAIMRNEMVVANTPPPLPGPFDNIPLDIEKLFKNMLRYRVDPSGEVYGQNVKKIIKEVKMLDNNTAVAVDGARHPNDVKGVGWDPYMESFILGCGGQITNYDKIKNSKTPVVFRGITKAKHMKVCQENNRDFYYIDTGYFGNIRKKLYHRITKNAMQNLSPIIERPHDRLSLTGWHSTKFRGGRDILLCPPSAKAMGAFDLDLDVWLEETISTIKQHTDRPIVIRKKVGRRERTTVDTIEMALSQNVHCLVTFNSIAATEAITFGKPAFTLGPNAAQAVSCNDLSKIETPYIPTLDEVTAWAAHLAYCQFTEADMRNGTAWKILNESKDNDD
ncbi:MAG: hypothetical protein SCH11_00730 [Nitrosomonadaceae bacterium]|nr:hypothetical protein [Nitrosomonadaceae bacterium]